MTPLLCTNVHSLLALATCLSVIATIDVVGEADASTIACSRCTPFELPWKLATSTAAGLALSFLLVLVIPLLDVSVLAVMATPSVFFLWIGLLLHLVFHGQWCRQQVLVPSANGRMPSLDNSCILTNACLSALRSWVTPGCLKPGGGCCLVSWNM